MYIDLSLEVAAKIDLISYSLELCRFIIYSHVIHMDNMYPYSLELAKLKQGTFQERHRCDLSSSLTGAAPQPQHQQQQQQPQQQQQQQAPPPRHPGQMVAQPHPVMGYPPAAQNMQQGAPRREQTNDYAALFVALIGT